MLEDLLGKGKIPNTRVFKDFLEKTGLLSKDGIFVYENGFIGTAYINENEILELKNFDVFLGGMVQNTLNNGFVFNKNVKTVTIISTTYNPIIVSGYLSLAFPFINFITKQITINDDGKYEITDFWKEKFEESDSIILSENIITEKKVNELKNLIKNPIDNVLCLIDTIKNSKKKLDVNGFFPFLSIDVKVYDPREDPSLLYTPKAKINTKTTEGELWVKEFGQPLYSEIEDFSKFILFK